MKSMKAVVLAFSSCLPKGAPLPPGGLAAAGATQTRSSSTPLLLLHMWHMMAVFFLTGLAFTDKSWLFAMAEGLSDLVPGTLELTGPNCWQYKDSLFVPYTLPFVACGVAVLLAVAASARWGRRRVLWAGLLGYIAARVLQVCTRTVWLFIAAENTLAFSSGLLMQTTLLDCVEVAPANQRARLVAGLFCGQYLGVACGCLFVFGLKSLQIPWGWRIVPIYALWVSVLLAVLLLYAPQSPADLVQMGQLPMARSMLQQLRGSLANVTEEFNQILQAAQLHTTVDSQLRTLRTSRWNLVALVWAAVMSLLVTGLGTTSTFNTARFVVTGLFLESSNEAWNSELAPQSAITNASFLASASNMVVIKAAAAAGAGVAVGMSDRIGRRAAIMLTCAAASCVNLAVAAMLQAFEGLHALPRQLVWMAVALISLSRVCAHASQTTLYAYMYEIQPLSSRSLAFGLLLAIDCCVLFMWQLLALPWLCALQPAAVFLVSAAVIAGMIPVAWLLLLETRNVAVEMISEVFQRHWLLGRLVFGGGSSDELAPQSSARLPATASLKTEPSV